MKPSGGSGTEPSGGSGTEPSGGSGTEPSGGSGTEPSGVENIAGVDSRAGWGIVAAAFTSTFAAFAVHYSFGSFFSAMSEEFGSDRSATSLFFALTNCFYFTLSVITGRLCDRFGPRPVLAVGGAALASGLLATSFVEQLWVGYITYAIGVGTGVACAYVPMVAVVGGWFERHRTTALGIAVAGIGAGTIVGAPLTEWLIDAYGWRTTFRVLAVGAGALLTLVALVARRPPGPAAGTAPTPVWETIRSSRAFWVLWISGLLIVLPLFVPFVYLADYVDERAISGSAGLLVGLIGVTSIAGRLGLGALASRVSVRGLYLFSFAGLGLSFLWWVAAGDSYVVLVVFAVSMGVCYGGYIALSPAVVAQIFGAEGLGGVLGAVYTAAGVGGLLGPPAAGWLIDRQGYQVTLMSAVVVALAAAAVLLLLPMRPQTAAATRSPGHPGHDNGGQPRT